ARQEVATRISHRFGGDDPGARHEPEQGPAGGRLARAGLADDPQPLAAERERRVAHRLGNAAATGEADIEVVDNEQGIAHDDFGSKTSRKPSPRRLKPRLTMKMARPGMVATHHWSRMTSRPDETMAPH